MLKSSYEFEVLINGSSAREYYHQGRTYIEGRDGSRFSLKMKNNSGSKVLFVPTVDGLSIMNGKAGSFDSRGYIVNAYDALTIDGWRTSDDVVAEFFFSHPKNSYAKKMSKGANLGVIGCAVFREKEKQYVTIVQQPTKYIYIQDVPSYPYPFSYYSSTTGGGMQTNGSGMANVMSCSASGSNDNSVKSYHTSASAAMPTAGLGTGFGQDKDSSVTTVSYNREETPVEVFTLYYNTRANLQAMGIEFKRQVFATPNAFPNEDGYCERPKNN